MRCSRFSPHAPRWRPWRFLAGVCAWLAVSPATALAADRPFITFLHICDVYNLSPHDNRGGFARLATRLRTLRAEDPEALFILPGDFLSPSLMSSLFHGSQMTAMLNLLRLDLATPGNHEFDQGLAVLDQNVAESRFLWLASNLERGGAPYPGMKPWEIRTVHGLKVGFFAVADPEFTTLARTPGDITVKNPVETAHKMIPLLRKHGAKLVVALSHMDFAKDRDLARQAPGIDLILGGHDHIVTSEVVDETLLVESGTELEVLGRVRMRPGDFKSIEMVEFLPLDERTPPDPEVAANVAAFEDKLRQAMGGEVGRLTVPLEVTDALVRTRETAVGNLVTDAMRASGGGNIALMNGGGLRSNRVLPVGPITRGDVVALLPFNNVLVTLEISGADLKKTLEHGLSGWEQAKGRFPHLSGLELTYSPTAPVGERVRQIKVGGETLVESRLYTLTTTDYLAEGGDGFSPLRQARRLSPANEGMLLTDAVIRYLQEHAPFVPPPLTRTVAE